jgi:hypothetical protein
MTVIDRFEDRKRSEIRQRAELMGFVAHHADVRRERNPYLQFAMTLRADHSANREAAVTLAAAWWRGWDRAAGG